MQEIILLMSTEYYVLVIIKNILLDFLGLMGILLIQLGLIRLGRLCRNDGCCFEIFKYLFLVRYMLIIFRD